MAFSVDISTQNIGPVAPSVPASVASAAPTAVAQQTSEQGIADTVGDVVTSGTFDGLSFSYNSTLRAVSGTNTDKGTVAVAAHVALADPHTQYLPKTGPDLVVDSSGVYAKKQAVGFPSFSFIGDTNTGISSSAADTMALMTSGIERLQVLSNGQVLVGGDTTGGFPGVGTGAAFVVGGTTYPTSLASINLFQANANGATLSLSKSRGVVQNDYTATMLGDVMGRIIFAGSDGTGGAVGVNVYGVVDGTVSTGSVPGRIQINTGTSGSGTERFRITSLGAWGLSGPNYGTAGQVLQSNGPGVPPTWGSGSVLTQRAMPANYTLVLADAGRDVYHTSATPHTLTVPLNASVAFPIGTVITVTNGPGAGAVTISSSATLRVIGTGATGSRTLAADGMITMKLQAADLWYLSGINMT